MGTRDGTLLMRYPLPATPPSCVPPPSVPTLHAIVTLLSRNAFTFGIAPYVLWLGVRVGVALCAGEAGPYVGL